ncbi:hypothetical protein BH09MYX1_BH09MYX1_31410 [soil metagenome]
MRARSPFLVALFVVLGILGSGCGPSGSFVWVKDAAPSAGIRDADGYKMAIGDLVNLRVFGQDNLSTRGKIRPDGMIAVPIVGDVLFKNRRPSEVAAELEAELKAYVVTPHVTITIEESQPFTVTVLGEVSRPATVIVDPSAGVLQALAAAGGFTDYADRDRIFVLRKQDGTKPPLRIRFSYADLAQGESHAVGFVLTAGDVVVVD